MNKYRSITDEFIKEKVCEVAKSLNIERMPTMKECNDYFGNKSFSNVAQKRFGWKRLSDMVGLPLKQDGSGYVTRICDNCGKEFRTMRCFDKRNRNHRFCCKKCEAEFRALGNTSDKWDGGYISKSTGYRYIRVNGKQVEEHRLVMEKIIGRKLLPNEVVHHINGNKLDNNSGNLAIMTRSQHQKLHALQDRTSFRVCAMCGKLKTHKARGLCRNCYNKAVRKGEIENYAKISKQNRDC